MDDFERKIKRKLSNRFDVLDLLGKGGMASVYRAVQLGLDREVALKLIHPNLLNDKESLERFKLEARSAAKINHTNVITVFDQGTVDEVVFMALEFLDGYDLNDVIELIGSMPLDVLLYWLIPTLEALDYVHEKGLIHRDIKGSNIFITKEGKPVLMDFGIASIKEMNSGLTVPGTVLGTPEFMSPEQANGEKIDQRSDIYSMGILIYQCLAGKVPFKGDTPISTIVKIKTEDIPPLSTHNISIPENVEAIIRKSLEKDKNNRYQTAGEMLEDILSVTNFVYNRNSGKKLIDFVEKAKKEKEEKEQFKENLAKTNSLNGLIDILKSAPKDIPGVEADDIDRSIAYVEAEIKSRKLVEGLKDSRLNPNLKTIGSDEIFFREKLNQNKKKFLISRLLADYLERQIDFFTDDFILNVDRLDILISGFTQVKQNMAFLTVELVSDDAKRINSRGEKIDRSVHNKLLELLPAALDNTPITEHGISSLAKLFPNLPMLDVERQEWVLTIPDLLQRSFLNVKGQVPEQKEKRKPNNKKEKKPDASVKIKTEMIEHSTNKPSPEQFKKEKVSSAEQSRSYISEGDVHSLINRRLTYLFSNDELINGVLQGYIDEEKKYGSLRRLLYIAFSPNVSDNVFFGFKSRMGSFKNAVHETMQQQYKDTYILEKNVIASEYVETLLNSAIAKMDEPVYKNRWDNTLKAYIQNQISDSNSLFSAFSFRGHEAKIRELSSDILQLLVSEFVN